MDQKNHLRLSFSFENIDCIFDGCFLVVSLLLTFLFGIFILNDSAYADYSISVISSGAQSLDVAPDYSSGGSNIGTSIGVDSIEVDTTCRSGYIFTLSTSVDDNNLYLNGSSSNNSSGSYFAPSTGDAPLVNSANTWGYYFNSDNPTVAPTKTDIFNAVPAKNSAPAVIKSPLPTPSSTDITDVFNIYYGVAVSNGLTPGTYKMIPDANSSNGTIVYQVTMASACLPYTVNFNPTSTAGGQTISGTGTMSPQFIPVGTTTNLNPSSFIAPSGYEFDSWNTAQDGTGVRYQDEASVTDLVSGGESITLYAQWKPTAVFYQVTVNFAGSGVSSVTLSNATYGGGGTVSSSGGTVNLQSGVSYTLTSSYNSGYKFDSYSTTSNGTLGSTSSSSTTYVVVGTATLTATGSSSVTYIQDFTKSDCSSQASSSAKTVYDYRDNQAYTVRYINGACWMTRNLAIGCNGSGSSYGGSVSSKNLTSTYSNVSSSWSTPTALLSSSSSSTETADYTTPRMQCSSTYGAWYNYAAATAGTITGTSSSTTASKDICPAGWHIPSYDTGSSAGSINSILNYRTDFNPVTGGNYDNGSIVTSNHGVWWTNKSYNAKGRYYLRNTGTALDHGSTLYPYLYRHRGVYVRCVRTT